MTAASVGSSISGSPGRLTGELIDSLIEAVVIPTDPLARSAVICELLNEVRDAVDWLHGAETLPDDPVAAENLSLRQLVGAAQDHQRRMRALCVDALGNGGGR